MIVTKENQELFPATWEYNAARITSELARIVENHGGRVKYGNAAIITNRTITAEIFRQEARAERVRALIAENGATEKNAAALRTIEKEIEKLRSIDNTPRRVTHTGYISFIYNGNYYRYSTDSNPFFEFYFVKTPVNNGKYSADAYGIEDKKEWFFDCLLSWTCSDADIIETANLIFNMLCAAPLSEIHRDGRRQRVKNTYNDGYHYETIYTPERIAKIDF